MNKIQWENYKRRTKDWRVQIEFPLFHSDAFRALKYAPSIKVLCWTYEKRKLVRTKRGGRIRYKSENNEFPFTYAEAKLRGLTHKQFSRALRELVGHGFLDLVYQGSGLQGNYSAFRLSERWKKFGQPDFEPQHFQKRAVFGCFGRSKHGNVEKQNKRHISAVSQGHFSALFFDIPWGIYILFQRGMARILRTGKWHTKSAKAFGCQTSASKAVAELGLPCSKILP